jgi:hypothetical protein
MNKKTFGLIMIVAGLALAVVSVSADALGVGSNPGMHWKQWAGTLAGLLSVVVGWWLGREAKA